DDNAIENDDDFEDNDKTLIVKKIRFKNSDIDDIYAARILKTKGGEVPGEELGKFMKEIEILKMLDGEQLMRLANEDIDDESLVILQDINNINSGLDVAAVTASCKVKSKYIIITFNYNNNICTIAIGIRIDVKVGVCNCFTFSATADFKAQVATLPATPATVCNYNYDDLISKMESHNCKNGI
ncbi:14505_t:CDS:2, partial [Entrophospora sp. SA101]